MSTYFYLLSLDYRGDIFLLIKILLHIFCNTATDLSTNFTGSMSQFVNEDIDVGGTLQ